MKSQRTQPSDDDQSLAIQIIYAIFSLIAAIFHAIRRALGFRIAQDDIDDFMYKPAPHFVSAAPADPEYQTLNDLDNESVFGRDKVAAAIKRRNNEINRGNKRSGSSSTSATSGRK